MNYSSNLETNVCKPLIDGNRDKNIDYEDEEDDEDDRIQPKCFNFKTEIKITIKYIIKECPRLF